MKANPKSAYLVILVFSLAFLVFAALYVRYDYRQAQYHIEEHGRVIADALWNFNETGAYEYLALAAVSRDYERLVVRDSMGQVFIKVDPHQIGWGDRILLSLGLIPNITIGSDIVFRDEIIGRIEAVWRPQAVYTLSYVFLALALFVTIILLYLRVLQGKQSLETRVRERTDELAMSNQSLKLEISERERAEDALRESREVLSATFESMNDGVLVVAGDGFIIHSNTRLTELWSQSGHWPAQAREENFIQAIAPLITDLNEFIERTKEIYATSQASEDLLQLADGRVIERVSMPLRQEGREAGRVWLFRDITDRKRAEEERNSLQAQLQQAQKMDAIGTLSSGIAHDFNNIMQVISGYIQLMQLQGEWDASTPRHLVEMTAAINKASSLVQGLLTFGRKVEPKLEALNLNHTILEILHILERTLPKMIQIDTVLSHDLKIIDADPNQLQRIILNLATNARDAMPDGGRLTIITRNITVKQDNGGPYPGLPHGEWVQLSFVDNGEGMEERTMQHIFEPFFTTKGVGQGTGLGLPVTYGIVKTHGGHIFCTSEPGGGTRFDLYFPVSSRSQSLEYPLSESFLSADRPGKETILLVDDEKSILAVAREVLRQDGYTILTADCAEEALDLYRQNRAYINLVILDLGMPGMGGFACLKDLLTITPDLKVLVASGYASDGLKQQMLEQGAAGFISKPYRLSRLVAQIRSALDNDHPPAD